MARWPSRRSLARVPQRSTAHSSGALPSNERVVKGQHSVADNLARLMAFARDKNDIARASDANRFSNRLAAPPDLRCSGSSGHNGGTDRSRIFASRVVVSDNHDI